MPHSTLELLGTASLRGPEGTTESLSPGKPLALLCFVALDGGGLTRPDAAALLWPASEGPKALASVRQALWTVKKAAGQEIITEDDAGTLTLRRDRVVVDLDDLAAAIHSEDPERVAALWNGGPLKGLVVPGAPAWNQWASELHADWERRVGAFFEMVATSSPPADRPRWTEWAVSVRPYRAATHVLHLRALIDAGRLPEAEQALSRARGELGEEADVEVEFAAWEAALRQSRSSRALAREEVGLAVPLVGRTREYSSLTEALEGAQAGRSQAVTVIGPPGIGKTRLVGEFTSTAEAAGAKVVPIAAALSERAIAYGAVGALVRDLLGLPGAAGISDGSSAVLRSIAPSRAGGNGPVAAQPSAAAIGDALADLVDAVAEETLLVLVVDDLQWADRESRALLQRAMRLVPRRPVLLISTCRSEDGDQEVLRGVRADAERGRTQLLSLEPLSEGDIRELLSESVSFSDGAALEHVSALVHRASRGHPLHAVSILRELRDRAVIVEDGDGWVFEPDSFEGEIEMPEGLQALLRQRLDRVSGPAAALLGQLGREPRARRPSSLGRAAGLSESEVSSSLTELLSLELVRWVDDERIDFSHALLREAVEQQEKGPTRLSWRWAAAAASLVLAVFAVGAFAGNGTEAAPWGDTVLTIRYPDRVIDLTPNQEGTWEWVDSVTGPVFAGDTAFWPWARVDLGQPAVLGGLRVPDRGPDVAIATVDGEWQSVLDGGGDDGLLDYGIPARPILVAVEDMSTPQYQLDLVSFDPVSGERRLLFKPEFRPVAHWSSDLRRINLLNLTLQGPDEVMVLRPDGSVAHQTALPAGQAGQFNSCGPRAALATIQPPLEQSAWHRIDWPSGDIERLGPPLSEAQRITCSPDGEYYAAARSGETGLVLYRREDLTEVGRIPIPEGPNQLVWRVATPTVPVALDGAAPDSLEWGEIRAVAGVVLDQAGREMQGVETSWRSLDPLVVGIRNDSVIGNGPGVASVIMQADGWLEDTVSVRVVGASAQSLLFAETFDSDWQDDWTVIGQPPPRLVPLGEGYALDVSGDSNWRDGVRSRASLPMERGLTAEVQFQLPLTDRRDRQSITFCLVGEDLETTTVGSVRIEGGGACIAYPQGELNQFTPEAARLATTTEGVLGYPAEGLGGEDWAAIGLQLRSDGRLSAIVNGTEVGEFPERVTLRRGVGMNVVISGRATDTQLLIRNVTVWEGPRY